MKNYLYIILIGLAFGCKVPYHPVDNSVENNYLVVEGVINTNPADSTTIKLSRTVRLSNNYIDNSPELNAEVYIEDAQGFTIKLNEFAKGIYITRGLKLDSTRKYRLRIKTTANKTYLSDMMAVTYTPPIDSVGFYRKGNGVQVYANTHDPKNNTRYYRWEYAEDWKFHAALESKYITNGRAIVRRTPAQTFPKYCWGSYTSYSIVVGSSVKLAQDVIYLQPITYIDGTSDKIMDRYRIKVKQFALSKEAFTFWEELKRNTESLGTIFDAQPSASKTNIHCVENALEPVVGYMSISNVQTKTAYFTKSDIQLPIAAISYAGCAMKLDSQFFCRTNPRVYPICIQNDVELYLIPPGSKDIPVIGFYFGSYIPDATPPNGYLSTNIECLDCTIRGVTYPPSLWKDN